MVNARLDVGNTDGCVQNSSTEKCHDRGQELGMSMVTFWNEITCSYIKEESGKQSQDDTQSLFGQSEKECGACSYNRGHSIDNEPTKSMLPFSFIFQNEIDRIDTIGKIMREHSYG